MLAFHPGYLMTQPSIAVANTQVSIRFAWITRSITLSRLRWQHWFYRQHRYIAAAHVYIKLWLNPLLISFRIYWESNLAITQETLRPIIPNLSLLLERIMTDSAKLSTQSQNIDPGVRELPPHIGCERTGLRFRLYHNNSITQFVVLWPS